MGAPAFDAPRKRLDKARASVADMASRAEVFLSRKAYTPLVAIDPETGHELHKIRITAKIPGSLTASYAEVLTDIRAALDEAVAAASAALGGESAGVTFPVADAEEELDAQILNSAGKAPAPVHEHFRQLKPHPGGATVLWAFTKLAAAGRRDMLKVTASVDAEAQAKAVSLGESNYLPWAYWDDARGELTLARTRRGVKPWNLPTPSLHLDLGANEARLQGPAIPFLEYMLDVAGQQIDALEALTQPAPAAAD